MLLVQQAGLTDKWFTMWDSNSHIKCPVEDGSPKTLSVHRIKGVVLLGLFSLTLAFAVLFGEIIHKYLCCSSFRKTFRVS
jgi:hypothetical protein